MKVRNILLASAFAFAAVGATAARAQVKEVEMVHWWTSGGEAAALNVLKDNLQKQGYAWKDNPIAGGGGSQAMTVLRARVTAGNIPTAVQMLGFDIQDWAEQGVLGDLTPIATKEGWDKVVPAPLQKFSKYQDKWIAAPVNVHSTNWIWANKAVMDKLGVKPPTNWDELIVVLDKAKAAGVIPLAHGGQGWQDATLFDSVVLTTGGPDFYKKTMIDLDPAALSSDTMKTVFDRMAKLRSYVDAELLGPRLEPRLGDGDQGRRRDADHGRLGEGRVHQRRQEARPGLPVLPLPRHAGQRDLQLRPVRHVQGRRRPPGGAERLSPRRRWIPGSSRPSTL